MKITMKEKVLLLVMAIILIVGLTYNFFLSDIFAEIKELKTSKSTVEGDLKKFEEQYEGETTINRQITLKKYDAEQLAKVLLSGDDPAHIYLKIKSILQNFVTVDAYMTEDGFSEANYTLVTQAQIDAEQAKIEAEKAKDPLYSGKYNIPTANLRSVVFSFEYTSATLTDFTKMLREIEDNCPYIIVSNFDLKAPTTANAPYTGACEIQVFVTNGDIGIYHVGECLNEVNGKVCGGINELDADICVACRQAIDECPNPQCYTLLTPNYTQCPVCNLDLQLCPNCNQLTLATDTVCKKCNQPIA